MNQEEKEAYEKFNGEMLLPLGKDLNMLMNKYVELGVDSKLVVMAAIQRSLMIFYASADLGLECDAIILNIMQIARDEAKEKLDRMKKEGKISS